VLLAALGCSRPQAHGAAAHASSERVLNVYNWSDYIQPTVVADFEKEYGVHVNYDVFDSNEILETKLLTGHTNYDIVVPSGAFLERQLQADVYRKLDKSLLPNLKNVDPEVARAEAIYDPGNQYSVDYTWITSGVGYNSAEIKARMPDAPVDSLDMIFKPELVAHFADCGVTLLDSAEDVLQLALNYLHIDPNSTRKEDYERAEGVLLAVRPYIRAFDSTEYMNGLANKEFCISMSWSGDYAASRARAKAAGVDVNLAFTVPKEGANGSFDAFLIPTGAPHPQAAHAFLNFMMEPRVIAAVTNYIHYANDNLAANAFVDPQILNDPSVYPTPEVEARLYESAEVSPALERIRTRTWTRIKTAK